MKAEKLTVKVEVENLEELKRLIDKTSADIKTLEDDIQVINLFELKVKTN